MSGSSASESCAETAAPRFPSALPQYEFLEFLGGGGMGEIYKARHVHLDRLVVIKWLRTDLAVGPQMDARFAREMLAVGQLNHPNIVAATDAGIANGRRYLVMEYIDGIDLSELCRRVGQLSIADACEIVRQSAIGLAHAHDRGIVHRDIKPTNLMLPRDGMVKLLDLGLALLQEEGDVGGDAPLTRADSGPFGTYDYMSPEQWNNSHEVDARGDIYSLGCTLYFLLTGHAPFDTPQHKTATAKMRGHILEAPPAIRTERPDVSRRLAAVIERTLAKDPAERYQSAAELAVDLDEFVPGCDLPSLCVAAQRTRTVGAPADVRTDPESATLLVGSSAGGLKPADSRVKSLSATGIDTAVGRSKTNFQAVAGVRHKRSRTWIPWLAGGAIALVLIGAGMGYLVSRNGPRPVSGGNQFVEGANTGQTPSTLAFTGASPVVTDTANGTNPGLPASGNDDSAMGKAVTATSQTTGTNAASGNPGQPPSVVPVFEPIPMQIVKEQQPFSLLVSVVNQVELRGKIAFALASGTPQGMRIDPVTGVVRWEPREEDGFPGARVPVTVVIKPLAAGVDPAQTTFEIQVEEVNKAPRISQINGAAAGAMTPVEATEGEPVEVLIATVDEDLPANRLQLLPVQPLPGNARIVPVDGNQRLWKLFWTPGEAEGGGDVVRVPLKIRDDFESGPEVTLAFRVAEVNQPPVLARVNGVAWREDAPWKVSASEGESIELTLVGEDADLPANPLRLKTIDPLPEGAEIVPVEDNPRAWKLRWTPGEKIGGDQPVTVRLQVTDASESSAIRNIVFNVAEVNSPPVVPEISLQKVGAGETWTLDVPVVDADLPRQDVEFELEQSAGMAATARWVDGEKGPPTLRLAWRPDAVADLGTTRRITLRVRDSGNPAMSAEREINIEVGRYLRNSLGMEFAVVPAGEFRMGNLDPEQLLKITPKAPPKPPVPNRPAGIPKAPFRKPVPPGAPFDPANPSLPAVERDAGGADGTADEGDPKDKTASTRPDDLPVRSIVFTRPLHVGAFEVTQEQYEAVMGENPSYFSSTGRGQRIVAELATEHFPVDSVNYLEAVEFCRRLSARPEEQARGRVYRLPTEAEWEYACRGGTETLFSTGNRLSSNQANFDGRYPLPGMEAGPFLERTSIVGSYEPNAFGLHDMDGNVSEWCSDWYADDAYELDPGPSGPDEGEFRVVRGGNYRSQWAYLCGSSIRDSRRPIDHVPRIGFRVVFEQKTVGPTLLTPQP